MSFMFNPYPYRDPNAVNRPMLASELAGQLVCGDLAVARALLSALPGGRGVLLVDGYVGASFEGVLSRLREAAAGRRLEGVSVSAGYKGEADLEAMLSETLPEDREQDPVLLFGKSVHRGIESLFDASAVSAVSEQVRRLRGECDVVVLYGCGAASKAFRGLGEVAAFVDVTPLETTLRIRARQVSNLGDDGRLRPLSYIFRRMYYYDYEIMMQHRQQLISDGRIDFYVDGNQAGRLKLLPLAAFKAVAGRLLDSPFRCTPVYIEGVWGGFYVKRLRRLPDDMRNCAWVFDMIPNEVSVQIKVGAETVEVPFSTIFKEFGTRLMGEGSVRRFGSVFPIRFNYDDTYGGAGNMSIQVHPPQAYNQEHFGEPFQQDESYYCVATAGSKTYLGLQDDCDVEEFFQCVGEAERNHVPFDHDKYVNSFPSATGDQFLLPGGTIHASGRNQVVLEIGSYTIGSYTFKLYDYLRRDLDGNPRPIHSYHGRNVLVTERRRSAVDGVLRPRPKTVREGDGWKEEILGEHDLIYFSLRRLSFARAIHDDTRGEKFHVLVLVEGEEVLVCSNKNPECCYHARFMDMVVVPASMGEYVVINLGETPCRVHKTMLK